MLMVVIFSLICLLNRTLLSTLVRSGQNRIEILLGVNYTVSSLSYYFNNKCCVGHMKQIYM